MDVKFNLSGKNFVVTGASSGIGYQTTVELLESGAKVLAIARHMSNCQSLKERFAEQIYIADVDVNDQGLLCKAIEGFVEWAGKIDGSVHCAGLAKMLPLNVWNLNSAQEMMRVNLWSGMALLKLLARKKYSNQGASYVYISSVSAHKGQKGMSIYSATKAALEASVRCLAQELASKMYRVNSVCLGWVETNMTKDVDNIPPQTLLGTGQPEDAAGIILFLLSSRAKWITGSNFVVDGGYLS